MNDEAAAPKGSLASRAARGTAISLSGQFVTHSLRLASNLVLTRILEPDAFGLILLVSAITVGLQMLSDVGIWQAVVQNKRQDRDFLDTAWTLAVLRGLLLFTVGCAATVPAAWLYGRTEMYWLLPLCAFQAVLLGLESTKTAQLHRQMALGRLVTVELVSQVLALAASVPIAFATRSVVALAAASIVAIGTRTIASHLILKGPNNRFRLERTAMRELFSFGSWIFLSTTLFFLGTRWDVFALGKLEGMELIGVYGLAQMILSVPAQMIDRAMGLVVLPALAERFREAPASFAADLRQARLFVLPAAAVLFLGAAMTAPAFFHWLYRDAYHDAGWLTQLAVGAAWFVMLQDVSMRAIVAAGETRLLVAANAARLVATIAATSLGFTLYGVVGFILGNAVGAAAGALTASAILSRLGARVVGIDLAISAAFLALMGAGCGLPWLLAERLGVAAPLLTLVSVVVIVGPLGFVVLRRARTTLAAARARAANADGSSA